MWPPNKSSDPFLQDYDSGLRALIGRERYDFSIFDLFFTHTNFVIGSKLPAYYSFMVRINLDPGTIL